MEYALARQGFELRVNVPEDLPTANIDADAMQQALLNLLGNAMKYSTDRRRIDLTLTVVDDQAVIQVTDYGLGIAPQDQPRLFERFYRAPIPENARIPGAGLGLSLVRHIVAAHRGSVQVSQYAWRRQSRSRSGCRSRQPYELRTSWSRTIPRSFAASQTTSLRGTTRS